MIGVGTFKASEKAVQYVNEVLRSGRLSYGPFLQKFEKVFSAAHDCRFGIMTNSGTSCLQIALAALKMRYNWQDGDEVIVPAVTFVATSNIVIQNNMKPIFVDIEPVFYEIDADKIEAAITPRTRCIIPVHLFGSPCEMDKIMAIAKKHNLRVIEDSCETMFTRFQGKSVGSFGDVGCFSTYVAHILITGVGGLCTTNDPDLAVILRSLMNHGRDSIYISIDDDKNKSEDEMRMIISRRFSFVQMGYSYRVTEMEGALGLAEFENHEEMMKKRWENGNYFIRELQKFSQHLQVPTIRKDSGHAFMMFPIVLKNEKKTELVNFLEKNGIETRDMLPLTNQPYYQDVLGVKEDDYPVGKWVNESGFYIASHQDLSMQEKKYIVAKFDEYFSKTQTQNQKSCLVLMSKFEKNTNVLSLDKLTENLSLVGFEQIILADASNHGQIAEWGKSKAMTVLHYPNLGKGDILKKAVESSTCENVVVMGVDGSDDRDSLDKILLSLNLGNDLVIASRFMSGGKRLENRFLSYRSIGNRFFSFLLSILSTQNISDCNNLLRGFKKETFLSLNLKEKGEGIMFEMTTKSLKNNLKIEEIPTTEYKILIERKRRNRILSALHFIGILIKNA